VSTTAGTSRAAAVTGARYADASPRRYEPGSGVGRGKLVLARAATRRTRLAGAGGGEPRGGFPRTIEPGHGEPPRKALVMV